MARNQTWVAAPPEAVWAVLADPYSYADWVVGAQKVLAADPRWPDPGTRLHHRVGIGFAAIRDRTCVEESRAGEHLVLDAAARPLGRARVEITLVPEGKGTRVHLYEDPSGFTGPLRFNPLVQVALRVRNAEALRRFKDLAERSHRGALRAQRRAGAGRVAAAG